MKRNPMIVMWLITLGIVLVMAGISYAGAVSYTYDGAGRLIAAEYGSEKLISYNYDNAGNLLSRTIGNSLSGDVFPDMDINLKDAILSLKIAARLNTWGIRTKADVNNDNKIGLEEAIYILQTISGMR